MSEVGTQYMYMCVYTHTHIHVYLSWTCMEYADILYQNYDMVMIIIFLHCYLGLYRIKCML